MTTPSPGALHRRLKAQPIAKTLYPILTAR